MVSNSNSKDDLPVLLPGFSGVLSLDSSTHGRTVPYLWTPVPVSMWADNSSQLPRYKGVIRQLMDKGHIASSVVWVARIELFKARRTDARTDLAAAGSGLIELIHEVSTQTLQPVAAPSKLIGYAEIEVEVFTHLDADSESYNLEGHWNEWLSPGAYILLLPGASLDHSWVSGEEDHGFL